MQVLREQQEKLLHALDTQEAFIEQLRDFEASVKEMEGATSSALEQEQRLQQLQLKHEEVLRESMEKRGASEAAASAAAPSPLRQQPAQVCACSLQGGGRDRQTGRG